MTTRSHSLEEVTVTCGSSFDLDSSLATKSRTKSTTKPQKQSDDTEEKENYQAEEIKNDAKRKLKECYKSIQTQRTDSSNPNVIYDENEANRLLQSVSAGINIRIGNFIDKFEPYIKQMTKLYTVLLYNFLIVAMLLMISRFADNKLPFNKWIFRSDSEPLLIAANVTLVISYSLNSFFYLRLCLSLGCGLFATWSLRLDPLLLDVAIFNGIMLLLNVKHAILLLYDHRHISFEPAWEQIYVNVFKPYLNRSDFQQLVLIGFKRQIKQNMIFYEKGDEVTSLCCLISGTLEVVSEKIDQPSLVSSGVPGVAGDMSPIIVRARDRKNKKKTDIKIFHNLNDSITNLHKYNNFGFDLDDQLQSRFSVDPDQTFEAFLDPDFINFLYENEFIESPQWISAHLDPENYRFEVSIRALTNCEFIKWPRESLVSLIKKNQNIHVAVQAVLGVHTARCLLRSTEYQKGKIEFEKQFGARSSAGNSPKI